MKKKPLLQGHLDGLCGLYAAINAMNKILGRNSNETLRGELFALGLKTLDKKKYRLRRAMLVGMKIKPLKEIVNAFAIYLNKKHDIIVNVATVDNVLSNSRGLNNELDDFLNTYKKSAVIVGIGGCYDHWSTITKTTKGRWKMADSGDIKVINKNSITTSSIPRKKKNKTISHFEILKLYCE